MELLEEEAPEGWCTVKKLDKGEAVGLVPEIYLGPAPRSNPDGPTEEQVALRKAQDRAAEVEAQLAQSQAETAAVEQAKVDEAAVAAAREVELKDNLKEMEQLEIQRLEAARQLLRRRPAAPAGPKAQVKSNDYDTFQKQ